jgi:amidohydrolase
MPLVNRFADLLPEITAWRRDIHAHPELLFDVHRTAGLVAERLRAFGCDEVTTGIGRTGVVGVIRGRATASGRVVGLRADMDALPLTETTALPHASTVPGRMHACGHDGHTSMLLGAARYLAETRTFDGIVVVIFQPAEEGGGGGREMVEDGLMDRFGVQEVFGLHNSPELPLGAFGTRAGAFFAASYFFTVAVEGRGAHAAYPHQGIDPTLAASHIVVALQSIVARGVDPQAAAVVSVTSFRTETDAFNIIPDRVTLKGTVRTLDPTVQDRVAARFHETVTATARAYGAEARVDYVRSYPVMTNSAAETRFAARVAAEVAGEGRVDADAPPVMGAEDFAFMLNARPGAMIFMGNGPSAALHNPAYDFNDEAIPYGCSYWVRLVETAMPLRDISQNQ